MYLAGGPWCLRGRWRACAPASAGRVWVVPHFPGGVPKVEGKRLHDRQSQQLYRVLPGHWGRVRVPLEPVRSVLSPIYLGVASMPVGHSGACTRLTMAAAFKKNMKL